MSLNILVSLYSVSFEVSIQTCIRVKSILGLSEDRIISDHSAYSFFLIVNWVSGMEGEKAAFEQRESTYQ